MTAFLCFLAGLLVGGIVAVGIMAALQLNRSNQYEQEIYELKQKLNIE